MKHLCYRLVALFLTAGAHLFLTAELSAQQTQTVGLFRNEPEALNGYTLFSRLYTTYLIDNCGFIVNQWESDHIPAASLYLLENGNLLRPGRIPGYLTAGGYGGIIEKFNWEGDLVWSYIHATDTTHQHHDIEPLPNGNVLVLSWEKKTREQAIAAGRDTSKLGEEVWLEQVVEVKPIGADSGEIVWKWSAWDHLVQDFDSSRTNYGILSKHPELLNFNYEGYTSGTNSDWLHCNAVSYNSERHEIILSSRQFSEIWIIDHSTTTEEAAGHSGGRSGKGGDILYRWGNPQTYDRGTSADRVFYGQHDARWIPSDYVHGDLIMVFNNGDQRPQGEYSVVQVISPPLDAEGHYVVEDDAPYGPQTVTWNYPATPDESFFSRYVSGAQRLSNGNTLICIGTEGRFIEVDMQGNVVWEYKNPVSYLGPVSQGEQVVFGDIFRVTRYPSNYRAFKIRDLAPGPPVELDPWPGDCQIYDNLSSLEFPGAHDPDIRLRSNLVSSHLTIENDHNANLTLSLLNAVGQVCAQRRSRESIVQIDISHLAPGMYFLHTQSDGESVSVERVVVR